MKLDNNLWSVFLLEHLIDKDKKKVWIKSYQFYYGNLEKTQLDNDERFKAIKNKRKEAIFLGLVKTDFPVKYPIKLKCSKVLNRC